MESVTLDTPIISTDVGGANELISKYNCGTLIGYDEEELAYVMEQYIESYEVAYKFNLGNDFDVETELSKTLEVIEDTINKKENKNKMKKLPYPVEKIDYFELKDYEIKNDTLYILEVRKNNVKYEYLINRKTDSDKLIVFNNGAIAGGNVKYPVFQRHSWAPLLKTSAVFCMDPTLYVNDLSVGWGVGKNDDYYLENSSLILKQLLRR